MALTGAKLIVKRVPNTSMTIKTNLVRLAFCRRDTHMVHPLKSYKDCWLDSVGLDT